MSNGIYSALAGAIAQERTLDVVANNLANVNTTGFKADKVAFSEMTKQQNGAQPQSMRFVSLDRIGIDGSAGGVQQTGNPLDLALEGDAYFTVQGPGGGERYTRAGSFTTDSEGTIRTHGGYEVLGESGTLSIPQGTKNIRVGADGTVSADGLEIGKLKLVSFANTQGLVREGLTMFSAGEGATPEPAEVGVAQGYLESANVNAVMGMTELIAVNRSFDMLQKVIETYKQLDERTARDLGK